MFRHIRIMLVAAMMAALLGVGLAGSAAASPAAQGIPQLKTPTSGRFVIDGHISSGGLTINLSGDGAFAKDALQMRLNVQAPPIITGTSPIVATIELIMVNDVAYIKVPGSDPSTADKWYSIDAATAGGLLPGGMIPGGMMPGQGSMVPGAEPLDPRFADAYTITLVGKEQTITGVTATRYNVDVDVKKLLQSSGQALPPDVQYGDDYKAQISIWIGDDQYLHQTSFTTQGTVISGDTAVFTDIALTIAFTNLDEPITITAPANAEPLPVGDLLGLPGMMGGAPPTGGPLLPPAPPDGQTPGMPRTGAGEQGLPLGLIGLGFVALLAGVILRRRVSGIV